MTQQEYESQLNIFCIGYAVGVFTLLFIQLVTIGLLQLVE